MNNVIIIDKPAGLTSHDVVQRVKKIFSARKAGHTGTLDPMATGVLPICLNEATKLSDQLMAGDKEYEVTIRFGMETDTFDTEGKVISESAVPEDLKEKIEKHLSDFIGEIDQVPPYYSAVKYKGRPLYKWARKGEFIDLPPRQVNVKLFEIKKVSPPYVEARIICSKGTYIRSICHDLGNKVGSGACMSALRRTATGGFHIDDAITLDELNAISLSLEGRGENLIPLP